MPDHFLPWTNLSTLNFFIYLWIIQFAFNEQYVPQTLDDDDEQHRSPSVGSSPRAHESGAQNADVPESPR